MYQLTKSAAHIKRIADNAIIPVSGGNADYVEYLRWVALGNTPLPRDAQEVADEAAQAAKDAQDKADAAAIKADAKFQNLISKTPAQAKNWVDNSFPTLTDPERKDLVTIVIAIGVLGRRL